MAYATASAAASAAAGRAPPERLARRPPGAAPLAAIKPRQRRATGLSPTGLRLATEGSSCFDRHRGLRGAGKLPRAASSPSAGQDQQKGEGEKAAAPHFLRLQPEVTEAGGLVVADQPELGKAQLSRLLKGTYMPINLDTPGLRILNIDPPIFTIPGFLTAQECDDLVNAALDAEFRQPGTLAQSAVGNSSGGADSGGSIRTSSTLGFTSAKLSQFPRLQPPLETLLKKAQVQRSAWSLP